MLYSYKNQYPTELPNRIRLSDGSTRTDNSTFTPEEIADAGYVEVPDKPIVMQNEILDWNGAEWKVMLEDEQTRISRAWDNIRAIRNGTLQGVEWRISRYLSEVRLGLTPTDDIKKLDIYMQELRDVTKQSDPFNIVWPILDTTGTINMSN